MKQQTGCIPNWFLQKHALVIHLVVQHHSVAHCFLAVLIFTLVPFFLGLVFDVSWSTALLPSSTSSSSSPTSCTSCLLWHQSTFNLQWCCLEPVATQGVTLSVVWPEPCTVLIAVLEGAATPEFSFGETFWIFKTLSCYHFYNIVPSFFSPQIKSKNICNNSYVYL